MASNNGAGYGWDSLDVEFVHPSVLKEETLRTLAALELDRHKLRMQLVIEKDWDKKLASGLTVKEALDVVEERMVNIKKEFADILDWVPTKSS